MEHAYEVPSSLAKRTLSRFTPRLGQLETALSPLLEETGRILLGGNLAEEIDIIAAVAQDGVLLTGIELAGATRVCHQSTYRQAYGTCSEDAVPGSANHQPRTLILTY